MYKSWGLSEEQHSELIRQRLELGHPLHAPPHPVRGQRYYLLTAACYRHVPHMHSLQRRKQLLDALFEAFAGAGNALHGWVVLLTHYHVLAEVLDFDTLGGVFQRIHGRAARQWNLEESVSGRKVWYRYTDRAIRSDRHYFTTLNYIHANPVKHGLVTSPYNWPESSVHWYLEQKGCAWLQDLWERYPVRDYGRGWDDF